MSEVEIGTKRSNDYDEYGEISSYKKRSRGDREKMRFLLIGRYCGAIIGKGGENIKRLRKENNIQINVQDTRSEGVLTLTGDRATCVSVFKEILPLIPESPYPVNPKEKCGFEVNFLVQSDQVGSIIGKGGQRIREIRDESSGKVRVYQDCLPNSNERIVAIGGKDESHVLAAFDIILKTLEEHPLKSQVIYYDPKNKDGPPQGGHGGHGGDHKHHMGGGNQLLGMGSGSDLGGLGGLGSLGGLGGLGGLGSLAGAAGILGQLGLGGQGGAGILGATGGLGGLGGLGGNLGGLAGLGGGGLGGGGLGGGGHGGNEYQNDRNLRGGDAGGFRNEGRDGDRGRRDQRNGNEFEDRERQDFGDMETETKVTVLNDMCGAIIGKAGQRIREIRQASGARVDFTETERGSKAPRVITITGTQRQIVIAQQMMAECVRNRTN